MKLLQFYLVILTILNIVKAFDINCGFSKHSDGYNCQALAFKVNGANMTITGVRGNHMTGSKNEDVEVLYVTSNYQMDYIPFGLSNVFPNIKKFDIQTTSLAYISKASFLGLKNLKSINFLSGEIEVIPEDTFSELIHLQTLNLRMNKIQKIEQKTFSSLVILKSLYLHDNKIFMLQSKLFINNVNLESINLSNNNLRIIGSKLIDNLKKLKNLNLEGNTCISRNYKNGFIKSETNKEIMIKCSDPYEDQFDELIKTNQKLNDTVHSLNFSINGYIDTQKELLSNITATVDEIEDKQRKIDTKNELIDVIRQTNQKLNETVNSLNFSITGFIDTQKELLSNITATVDEIEDKQRTIDTKNEIIEEIRQTNQKLNETITEYIDTQNELLSNITTTIDEIEDKQRTIDTKNEFIEEIKQINQKLNETITEYIDTQNELLSNITTTIDEIEDKQRTINTKNEIIEELKLKNQQTVNNLTYFQIYSINLQQTIDETNNTTILLGETIEELEVNLTLAIENNDNLKDLLNSNLKMITNQTNELQQKLVSTESFLKTYKHSLYLSGLVLIAVMISFIIMEIKHKKSRKSAKKSASVKFVKGEE